MPRLFLLCWLLILPVLVNAATPRENAEAAQALLGERIWSRLLQIENGNARSIYPARTFAVVFELGGLLWFYTDENGTQSLSLHQNNLAAEKADLAPLLRAIDPGFVRFETLADETTMAPAPVRWTPPPNACFIESYAALRERAGRGELVLRARLLSFYVDQHGQRLGHTALVYESPAGSFVLDPLAPRDVRRVDRSAIDDAWAVARVLRPDLKLARARWVPVFDAAPALADLAGGRNRGEG